MPERFSCPRLEAWVELTDERREHILRTHGDGIEVLARLGETFERPDVVMKDAVSGELLIARAFDFAERPRHIVGIVIQDEPAGGGDGRMWVVTAFTARRLPKEGVRWRAI